MKPYHSKQPMSGSGLYFVIIICVSSIGVTQMIEIDVSKQREVGCMVTQPYATPKEEEHQSSISGFLHVFY